MLLWILKYFKNVRSTLKQLKRPGIIKYYSDRFQNLRDYYRKNSAEKSGCSKQDHISRYMYDQSNPLQDHSNTNQRKKWVKNLSSTPLIPTQEVLLAHGINFAVTPTNLPILDYISSIEVACQNLNNSEAEELRSDVYRALRLCHPPQPKLRKEEMKALKQLKTDKDLMVLTADKGVAMAVMDRQEYIKKARALLEDTNAYRSIPSDLTTKLKNKLINILKKIKTEGNMDENTYRRIYPTGASAPKFYGLPKIHKKDVSLRPIVSNIGSVTYGVAKELSRILKPLVGKSIYHINNSKEFAEEIRNTRLEEGECITSFDVTALFTSITVATALEVIKGRPLRTY